MKIRTVMPVLALSSALALAGCGDDAPMEGMDMGSGPSPSATSSPSAPGPADSSAPAPEAEYNQADVMFLQMMYPHHAQATEMAQLVEGRTDNPDVLGLAQDIEQAQSPEMEQMSALLESFGEPAPSSEMGAMEGMDHSGGGSMSGMMTEQDMTSLGAASGEDFDRMWLTMMIEHHTGAIEMSRTQLQDGANPDARRLATDITDSQQAEITTMQQLLDQP